MNEAVEFFDGPPTFMDLVDRAMRKYGCRVDEMTLKGRFDCGRASAHYVLMNLASDSNWKHYKDAVHEANVACLEVVVEIVRMPGPNVVLRDEVAVVNHKGTQESEILQHVLGETESAFDLAIANDDFSNDNFKRDEANIDDDDISIGSKDSEFKDDGVEDVEGEEESPSQSDGHENENEESQYEEDGPQFNTTTMHDVETIGRMDECFSYTQNELRLLKECDVELPSVPNDKDISMIHKAICESSMVNSEGIPFSESLVELKFFLADYAVRLHRPFSVVHSEKNLRYNCTAKYLGRRILGIILKDSETSVPSLLESIFSFSGYRVRYSKAWRAKQHAVALLWGDWKESYGMVPRVLIVVVYYNPGVKWFIDSCGMMHPDNGVLKHMLQRVFWYFPQCSVACQHCRPVILMDGTFLTGKYKGTLLMAVGVDPEQQLVPLAFALAESENNESWSWFMKLVQRHVLGPSRQVCIISDRHYGLLNCVNDHMDGFPPLVHRWCTRHFATNMMKWRIRTNGCKLSMREGCVGGIMTMNYWESLNTVFKGIRSRPISGIIEYSFKKCNAYFVDRWQKARAMLDEGHRTGKVADKFISEAKLRFVHHLPEPYEKERMVYSVRGSGTTNVGGESHRGRHYRVDLNEVSCTYNVLQLLHLPSHYLQRARFLDIAVQVVAGLPPMDEPLLTTMVDRWCLETHTFHLPFGEMTITMQDVVMILGLPLEGHPHAQPVHGNPVRRYRAYTNELDVVTQHQFGRIQTCPPLELSTLQQLHRIDRWKRYKENDWRSKHASYLTYLRLFHPFL
uniref:MULE transposase domain-containing protein n=1 Tax=Setaria italica TaxID=4555 RepID=K3YC73_SETIT